VTVAGLIGKVAFEPRAAIDGLHRLGPHGSPGEVQRTRPGFCPFDDSAGSAPRSN
jgi:hypothetical protein